MVSHYIHPLARACVYVSRESIFIGMLIKFERSCAGMRDHVRIMREIFVYVSRDVNIIGRGNIRHIKERGRKEGPCRDFHRSSPFCSRFVLFIFVHPSAESDQFRLFGISDGARAEATINICRLLSMD